MKELLLISGLGIAALLAGLLNGRKVLLPLVIIGLLANIGFCVSDWGQNEMVYGMMQLDNFALAFTCTFSAIALIWLVSATDFFEDDDNFSDRYALILFSLTGGLMLVSFTNMLTFFLGVEILSIPLYVLVGSNKQKFKSNEAAFKYFVLGAFASAFMLFGIALIYGATGSFDIATIAATPIQNSPMAHLFFVGMILILMSIAFKASVAPFHFWTPDVYDGAPTNMTAYMATIVKIVAFAAFLRLFQSSFAALQAEYVFILSAMCALTLLLANLTASVQTSVKRMLAYSSISHAGFMLIAIFTKNSANLLLYYGIIYSLSSISAFTVLKITKAANNDNDDLDTLKGIIHKNPLMAISMTMSMLSLAGIPPLAGFFAKYFTFAAAITEGLSWLVVVAITATLIAVYYYFKVIITVFSESENEYNYEVSTNQKIVLFVCSSALIILSIIPEVFTNII